MRDLKPVRVVFEVNGWVVEHTTTLWHSHYMLAVTIPDRTLPAGEFLSFAQGLYNEPLSYLLARFDPEILASLKEAVAADKRCAGAEWSAVDQVREDRINAIAAIAADESRGVPVSFSTHANVFEE